MILAKVPEKVQKRTPPQLDGDGPDDIALEIAKRIGNLVPAQQRGQVVAQMVSLVTEERFSGPLPHPKHLREYEDICPGAADRIIKMGESNLAHAQILQTTALQGDIADVKAGRAYGFWALLALIGSAGVATYLGHELIAGAFLGTGVLGVVGQLIQGRRRHPADE